MKGFKRWRTEGERERERREKTDWTIENKKCRSRRSFRPKLFSRAATAASLHVDEKQRCVCQRQKEREGKKKEKENYNSVMFCCITGSASRTPGQLLTRGVICRLAASHFVGLSSPPRILVITCTVFVYRGLFEARQHSVIMEGIIKLQR